MLYGFKFIGRKMAATSKQGLLLGGAARYVRLYGMPRHSHITATAQGKHVPADARNIL